MGFYINWCVVMVVGVVFLMWGMVGLVVVQVLMNLRFLAVFLEQDIWVNMMKQFGEVVKVQGFDFQFYYGGILFKQGIELVVMQCGNFEMGNIVFQDILNQILEWFIVILVYLFCDVDYLKKVFVSDVGQQFKKMVLDKFGIYIFGLIYFGV